MQFMAALFSHTNKKHTELGSAPTVTPAYTHDGSISSAILQNTNRLGSF